MRGKKPHYIVLIIIKVLYDNNLLDLLFENYKCVNTDKNRPYQNNLPQYSTPNWDSFIQEGWDAQNETWSKSWIPPQKIGRVISEFSYGFWEV